MRLASLAGAVGLALCVAAATLLPAGDLAAQQAEPAAEEQKTFSKEHLRAAAAVVEAAKAAEGIDEVLPIVAEQTRALFLRSNPEMTAQIEDIVTDVAIRMAAKRPEVDKIVNEVWARRFTLEELEAIRTFYESSAGRKLAEVSPEVIALTVGAARQWEQQLATDMVTEVRAEIAKINAADKTEDNKN